MKIIYIVVKVSLAILTMTYLCCLFLLYYYGNAAFHGYIILFGILRLQCYDKILIWLYSLKYSLIINTRILK